MSDRNAYLAEHLFGLSICPYTTDDEAALDEHMDEGCEHDLYRWLRDGPLFRRGDFGDEVAAFDYENTWEGAGAECRGLVLEAAAAGRRVCGGVARPAGRHRSRFCSAGSGGAR